MLLSIPGSHTLSSQYSVCSTRFCGLANHVRIRLAVCGSVTDFPKSDIMNFAPLGDQGVLATFPVEAAALHFAAAVETAALRGIIDIVPA
jgi:hypothetical protein